MYSKQLETSFIARTISSTFHYYFFIIIIIIIIILLFLLLLLLLLLSLLLLCHSDHFRHCNYNYHFISVTQCYNQTQILTISASDHSSFIVVLLACANCVIMEHDHINMNE